jgi:hypothetical protein
MIYNKTALKDGTTNIRNQVDCTSLVSVLERCESAINVQIFLGPWANGTTNCSLDLCNFNTVLDIFEELYCSVGIWVGVLCHLLKFVVPSFNAVLSINIYL